MKAIKILAIGTYKRFLWLEINNKIYCIKINRQVYIECKKEGIITCQKLSRKKSKQ